MNLAVGVIGALAILSYIFGLALASSWGGYEDSDSLRKKKAAARFIVAGWILTMVFAFIGAWGTENRLLAAMAWTAVAGPFGAVLFRSIKRQWIPAVFMLVGLLAAPVLYFMLLVK